MRKIFSVSTLFFLNVILFAQNCDEFSINTNAENTYTLCNGIVNIPFSILNPEQFEHIDWIVGNEYHSGSNVNFSLNQTGTYTLTIQAEDINGCFGSDEIHFQVVEGPNTSNVTANLNSSITNHDCLEVGSTHELTPEISSLFTPSSILWYQTGATTLLDYTFEVEVGNNDVYNYPIQVQFDECNVELVLEHAYTIQYETSFSNPYDGTTLCNGQTITLTNTSPHLNWDSNFSWDIEDVQIISESPNNITFSYVTPGTYNWQLNYDGFCLSDTANTVTVDVADADDYPLASIDSDDIEFCELPYNLNVNVLADNPSTGSLSYNWALIVENTTITTSNSETFEYEIQNSGTYELILEVSNNSLDCTVKDTILVSADDLNLDLNLNSISECEGYYFQPMDSATNSLDASVIYLWEIIDTDGTIIHSSTEENPSFEMVDAGIFDLSIALSSVINNNCDATILFEDIIEINANPPLELSSDNLDICEFPYELTVTDTSEFMGDYSWALLNQGDTLTSGNNEPFTYNFESTGANILSWENIDNITSCFSTQEIAINLDSVFIVLDSTSESFINYCTPYTFSPGVINLTEDFYGTYSYEWQLIDSLGDVYQTLNSVDESFEVLDGGIYDLQLTVSNEDASCFDQVILEEFVEVYDYDLALGILESNSCFSESEQTIEKTIYADFNAPSTLATSYSWEISSTLGVNTISSNSDTIVYAFTEAGNYNVTYTITVDGSECIYSEQISFGIDAIAEINMYSAICLGNEFTLTEIPDAAVSTNTSFLWTTPNSELIIADSTANPTTVSSDVAGNYTLELTVTNDLGCTASDQTSVQAYEVDALFFTGDSGEQCNPAIVEFQSVNNDYIINYTWNIHETTYQGLESNTTQVTNSPNFETLFNEIALYDIELIINSQHGCADTMLIENYVDVISPLPYFTLPDPWTSCDSVYQDIIDLSLFIDSFNIDYGNGAPPIYNLNDTNQAIYTYPPDGTSSTVYYPITMTAHYKFCSASYTDFVSIDLPDNPTAPFINYVTINEQQDVVIEWDTSSLVDNFNMISLYHETASNSWNFIGSSNQIIPNYFSHNTPTNLVNHYTAVQEDSCNLFSDSSIVHSTILLGSTTPDFQKVDLNWTRYYGWNNVGSYDIFRSEDGAPYQLYDSVAGDILSYQDSNLCNVLYSYYVVANHPAENFQSHSNKSSIVPDFVVYTSPIDVEYTSVSVNENIITRWNAPIQSDLTYYNIDRWDDYSEWVINYDHSTGSAYIDTNVNVNVKNYIYRVSYADLCGNFGPNSGNIGKNILLKGTQTGNEFHLTWNPYQDWDAGVDRYIIQHIDQNANIYQTISSVSGSTFNYTIDDYFTDIDSSYCYRVVAINAADSTIQSSSNLRCFIPKPKIYFPNAFSPNDDNINETFKYEGEFAKNINAKIYSRWGDLLYSSDEVDFEWDGKNENTGKVCPQGTYVFRYELIGYDGTIIKDEMVIFLLR